jgi:hypothetical protein
MATTAQLIENSHQGFDGIKAALCLGSMEVKSNTASGMEICLWRNGIGSRSSGKERDETGLGFSKKTVEKFNVLNSDSISSAGVGKPAFVSI